MSDELVSTLRSVLRAGPALRLAVLFGSAVRDQLTALSDVDVGIVPNDPDLELAVELDLQARLALACRRNVDLVRLDHATTLVRWQVAKDGRLLYAQPHYEWVRFVARAASDYGDFAPALAGAAARYRQRLAHPPVQAAKTARGESIS
jgi:predicted nucleotidyltransferase